MSGLKNLAVHSYTPLYDQMFSASDYLSVAETGTDLWLTANNKTNTQQLFYYEGLTTNTNATNKLFNQAYISINTCNAVINRPHDVESGDMSALCAMVREANCLRSSYYIVLLEHYGVFTLIHITFLSSK